MGTESFKGKGTLYLRRKNAPATEGFLSVGNCSEINIAFAETKQEQKDYEEAGGSIIDTHTSIDSVTASLTVLNLNAKNLARATGGADSVIAAATVTAEAHTATGEGSFIKFDSVPDTSQAITVTDTGATTTYVDGTDYEIRNGGILLLPGTSITAGSGIEVTYEGISAYAIETLTLIGEEYEAYFDGLNEARSGKPVLLTGHRVKLNPTDSLPLISDDFASLGMSMDFLKDDSVTGTGVSKYIKIEMAA